MDMLVACRVRVDQVTIDISTDTSVDVSIEVRFKIHDPASYHASKYDPKNQLSY